MSMDEDQQAYEANAAHRDYIARTFIGDNLFVGLATDPPLGQAPTKSALEYGKRRDQAMRARRLDEAKQTAATAAQLDNERRAYDRVLGQIQAGDNVTEQDLLTADRYAKREGKVPPRTSAQKLAAQR